MHASHSAFLFLPSLSALRLTALASTSSLLVRCLLSLLSISICPFHSYLEAPSPFPPGTCFLLFLFVAFRDFQGHVLKSLE
ncbi:uncharacterized protein B0T23DRAFT_371983 [Neurospora hispaniola]|uniref:Secreted protein n=1 Tax=Neurospora hispaniola TaxID=588809 RepID=A0AAJ0IHI9_9PEZI|nr:hypothetical protein B0T23DRAFT_371983 [Neurospora hispaniola]